MSSFFSQWGGIIYNPMMNDLERSMREADSCLQKGKFRKAIKILRKNLKLYSREPLVLYNLGIVYYRMERYEKSIEVLEQAITIDRTIADIFNQLGMSYDKSGERKTARECYTKALALNPEFAPGWNNLGVLSFLEGNYREAYTNFKKSLNYDPENSDTWYNYRDTCSELGMVKETAEADRKYREFIRH